MIKKALSYAELMIAMTLILVLTTLTIKGLKIFIKKDTDLMKYKPVLGTISEAVYQLVNDPVMYPTRRGFANLNPGQYEDDEKVYEGPSKFRKLFKSKFNVLEHNVKFSDNSVGKVPAYKYTEKNDEDNIEKVKSVNFNELNCFIENRGVMYCLPDIDVKNDENLTSVFVRTYFNAVDVNRQVTFDNTKAIYFEILANGKVVFPPTVKTDNDIIINCMVKQGTPEAEKFASYNQCLVRSEIANVEVYSHKR